MKLHLHHFQLRHKHPFGIARGTKTIQDTCIVGLEDEGCIGYGEAAQDLYYGASITEMHTLLNKYRSLIEDFNPQEPEALWSELRARLGENPCASFALAALDIAAHDLKGKLLNKPLYQLWGLDNKNCILSNYTIGLAPINKMLEKIREYPDFHVYKIKLGGNNDLNTIRALRQESQALFRADANCGWNAEECIELSEKLIDYDVEFIEQPLPADDLHGMSSAYVSSALPLIADESCIHESDIKRCAEYFHGVNIKLCKCAGITPAKRMIAEARELNLKVMMGCMTESTVGISAIAQFLPLLDYVDLDGAIMLGEDIAEGAAIDQFGCCHFPKRAGTGVQFWNEARPSSL